MYKSKSLESDIFMRFRFFSFLLSDIQVLVEMKGEEGLLKMKWNEKAQKGISVLIKRKCGF